jgi:hypothetical protein
MCYRDTTFCVSSGCKNKCGRQLTNEIQQAAYEWWGGRNAPIAIAEFCDDNGEVKR